MTKTHDIEAIRRVVTKRHGGFAKASDDEILRLWRTLSEETQQKDLAGDKSQTPPAAKPTKEKDTNADSPKSQ